MAELEHQLRDSGSKVLFTNAPLLPVALEAALKVGIPKDRVYLLELPKEATGGKSTLKGFKTVNDLIEEGERLPRLEALQWESGQGARQTAFLCYSSGTSGLPVCHFPSGSANVSYSHFACLERCQDLTPQCHSECVTDRNIRETVQGLAERHHNTI